MAVSINNTLTNSEYASAGLRNQGSIASSDNSKGVVNNGNASLSKLSAGSTFSGEVVSKDGNVVTLKLSNNQMVSARLDGNPDINVGQKVTFEVAKSGLNQTTIRPLYSNLAANSAVSAALSQANLPQTQANIAFTNQMMQEGMPINRNALWDMSKTVSSFPNADPTVIVQMTKIGMEINQTNISQFENYKNFQHQIVNDAANIAKGLNDIIKSDVNNNLATGNLDITSEILSLIDTDSLEVLSPNSEIVDINGTANIDVTVTEETVLSTNNNEIGQESSGINAPLGENGIHVEKEFLINSNLSLNEEGQKALLNDLIELSELTGKGNIPSNPMDAGQVINIVKGYVEEYLNVSTDSNVEGLNQNLENVDIEVVEGNAIQVVDKNSGDIVEAGKETSSDGNNITDSAKNSDNPSNVENNSNSTESVTNNLAQNVNNNPRVYDPGQFLKNLGNRILGKETQIIEEAAPKTVEEQIKDKISSILKSDNFGKVLQDSIKAQFSMNPADVSKEGKIEELYNRISKTSAKVNELMNSIGQSNSPVAQAANNISDNVNFMNQLNQYLNYVQLPLRMAGEDAHGELFVYTKKKNLSENDGNFTALLHLDMDHLGPMDVYVSMKEYTKVNTNFMLQNEALLDFIGEHINELTERLEAKGYNASVNVSKKAPGSENRPITDEFVKNENGTTTGTVSKLCFDVRA